MSRVVADFETEKRFDLIGGDVGLLYQLFGVFQRRNRGKRFEFFCE
jgi:hypothetical protein